MLLDLAVIAAALITIGSYTWSVRVHFRSGNMEPIGKILFALVVISGVFFAFLVSNFAQPVWAQILGLVLMAAAYALFWWTIATTRRVQLLAVYTDDLPHTLVTDGPYKLMRHPFYSSYIVFWLGYGLATAHYLALPFVVLLLGLYDYAARGEEEKFSRTAMAEQYAEFCKTRNRFIPFPKIG